MFERFFQLEYTESYTCNMHGDARIEVDLFSSSVEYCGISNVNSYQCSCAISVYAMCYSVINPCGYWTSGTLSALVSNRNSTVAHKGHTCKFKMLLQIKNCTCKLKVLPAN